MSDLYRQLAGIANKQDIVGDGAGEPPPDGAEETAPESDIPESGIVESPEDIVEGESYDIEEEPDGESDATPSERRQRRAERGKMREENARLREENERLRAESEQRNAQRLENIEGMLAGRYAPQTYQQPKEPQEDPQDVADREAIERGRRDVARIEAEYNALHHSGKATQEDRDKAERERYQAQEAITRAVSAMEWRKQTRQHQAQMQQHQAAQQQQQRTVRFVGNMMRKAYPDVAENEEALAYAGREYQRLDHQIPDDAERSEAAFEAARARFSGPSDAERSRYAGTRGGSASSAGDGGPGTYTPSKDEIRLALAAFGDRAKSPREAVQMYVNKHGRALSRNRRGA